MVTPNRTVVPNGFAFLIHMRDIDDLYRKFPLLRRIPRTVLENLNSFFWPITVSKVTGLKNLKSGEKIPGWIIGIPLTARQMLGNRTLALKKIRAAARLAEKKGARVIGLGAMTASLSRGGRDLVKYVTATITTGHTYTVHNVTSTLFAIAQVLRDDISQRTVAIVGAGGSIGSNSARIIARHQFARLLLVDLAHKNGILENLKTELSRLHPNISIVTSNSMDDVREADYVVTATSAPEALVRTEHLKPGVVIVDDAQPTDIDRPVFENENFLVLEAGAVRTPGISSNFNIDLQHSEENFSCMAELLILAAHEEIDHVGIGSVSLEAVDMLAEAGQKLGFTIAPFQNMFGKISEAQIVRIQQLRSK